MCTANDPPSQPPKRKAPSLEVFPTRRCPGDRSPPTYQIDLPEFSLKSDGWPPNGLYSWKSSGLGDTAWDIQTEFNSRPIGNAAGCQQPDERKSTHTTACLEGPRGSTWHPLEYVHSFSATSDAPTSATVPQTLRLFSNDHQQRMMRAEARQGRKDQSRGGIDRRVIDTCFACGWRWRPWRCLRELGAR